MSRDHRKLRAFELADSLVLEVYRVTTSFPSDERFGLTSQLRRGAVSIASNIVEGCARRTERDFLQFIIISHGACRELLYQLSIAYRLGFMPNDEEALTLQAAAEETSRVLAGLVKTVSASASGSGLKAQDSS